MLCNRLIVLSYNIMFPAKKTLRIATEPPYIEWHHI
jgi:hypothetical protein